MEEKEDGLYKIGEISRLSGVSVKTIRHYSDVGVLPPSGVTEAGYRMYSGADRSRLELVRTLRAAGFDLPTVRRLLEGDVDPSEALGLQAEAVDLQLRTLTRSCGPPWAGTGARTPPTPTERGRWGCWRRGSGRPSWPST